MRELYFEENVTIQDIKKAKIRYYIFLVVAICALILGAFWFYCMSTLDFYKKIGVPLWLIICILPALTFFAISIFSAFIKNKFYTEYDYSVLTGAIRFSKVIKQTKRKPIISIPAENIERIGNFQSETYQKYAKIPKITKKVLSPNAIAAEGKAFYYIVANMPNGKYLFVIECSKEFISAIMLYCKRHVLEENFK